MVPLHFVSGAPGLCESAGTGLSSIFMLRAAFRVNRTSGERRRSPLSDDTALVFVAVLNVEHWANRGFDIFRGHFKFRAAGVVGAVRVDEEQLLTRFRCAADEE